MTASKAQQAETATRRTELIRLRRAGVDFDDIVPLLGYSSRGDATKDMKRALEQRRDEQNVEASLYRQEHNERLDALLAAVWPAATGRPYVDDEVDDDELNEPDDRKPLRLADSKAVELVLKIMERHAKVNGYDAPVKAEVTGAGGGPLALGASGQAELHRLIGLAGDPDEDDLDAAEDQGDDGDSTRN